MLRPNANAEGELSQEFTKGSLPYDRAFECGSVSLLQQPLYVREGVRICTNKQVSHRMIMLSTAAES